MNEKQMQDMAISILLDEYTQLDVTQLLKEYEEEEENGELPNVPAALDEKSAEMIRREFTKKKQKKIFVRISKVLSRVAVVILALIGLCTVSVVSVKAWRMPVLQFFVETFDRCSAVIIDKNNSVESKTPEEIIEVLKEDILSNYKLVYESLQDEHYAVRFRGKNGESVNLIITAQQNAIFFDAERTEGTWMYINDRETVFINKNGYKIIWLDEEQNLLFDFWMKNVSEKVFWKIVHKIVQ